MEEKALEFLLKYSEWVKDAGIFSYMWRKILWGAVKGLYWFASFCEGLVDQIFTLSSFLKDGTIGEIYKTIQILAGTVLGITLIYIAFKLMFNQKVSLKGVLVRSIVFGCLIVQFPAIINTGMDISKKTYDETKTIGNSESTTLSFSMVKDNIADLSYLAKHDFKPLESEDTTIQKNNLTESVFKNADLTQVLTPKDVDELAQSTSEKTKYLRYKLEPNNDGELIAQDIKNGFFSMFDEGKFRFEANWGAIFVGLLTLSCAFVFSAFVIGTSIIELIFTKLLFPVLAVSDVETGQRVKHVLMEVGKSFLQIILTGISLSIFRIYFSFISTKDFNIVVYTIVCIIGIKVCIDGANAFGKYLGIDVGIRSGYQALVGTAMAAKGIKEGASGVGKALSGTANLTKEGAAIVKNGVGVAADVGMKSVNNASKLVNNGAMALGSAGGQISEYGLGGFAKEKVADAKSEMKNKVDDVKDGVNNIFEKAKEDATKPFKKIGYSYASGREDGLVGAINKKSQKEMADADDILENNLASNGLRTEHNPSKYLESQEPSPSINLDTYTPNSSSVDVPEIPIDGGDNFESDSNTLGQMQVDNGTGDFILGENELTDSLPRTPGISRHFSNVTEQEYNSLGASKQTPINETTDGIPSSQVENKSNTGTSQKQGNVGIEKNSGYSPSSSSSGNHVRNNTHNGRVNIPKSNDGTNNSGTVKSTKVERGNQGRKEVVTKPINTGATEHPSLNQNNLRNEFSGPSQKVKVESNASDVDNLMNQIPSANTDSDINVDFDSIFNTEVSGDLDNWGSLFENEVMIDE